MRTNIVFTLTGPDRVGIVEEVTAALLGLDGNVSTSRMSRLGGEFAILMLVELPAERLAEVEPAFAELASKGYSISTRETAVGEAGSRTDWLPYQVDVVGADHEGIVHEIAHGLSVAGINIESMETATTEAPVSGVTLFSLKAFVAVPPELPEAQWIAALEEAAQAANVDFSVAPADKR